MEKGHFEKYVNLIRSRAHYYSKRYNIEYEELESQGFEIYVNSLDDFDISKSTFSTHLFIQLNRLNDYCLEQKRKNNVVQFYEYDDGNDNKVSEEDTLVSKEENIELKELLQDSKTVLSENAYKLLDWILSWKWERKYVTKPTINIACKYFNKPRSYIENLWNECKNYWNLQGYSLYY